MPFGKIAIRYFITGLASVSQNQIKTLIEFQNKNFKLLIYKIKDLRDTAAFCGGHNIGHKGCSLAYSAPDIFLKGTLGSIFRLQ